MKKIILITSLFIITTFTLSAQVGLSVRLGLPTLTGDAFKDVDSQLSFGAAFAVDVEFPLTKVFSIDGDLGYCYDLLSYDVGFSQQFKFQRIQLRLFGKAQLPAGPVKPFVKAGLTASHLAGASYSNLYSSGDVEVDNKNILGYALEGGIEFNNLAGQPIELALFYQDSFTSMFENYEWFLTNVGINITAKF